MTVYAFSTENWRRPLDEVRFLMNFNERLLVARRDELNERGRAGAVHRPARRPGSRAVCCGASTRPRRSPRATAASRSRSRSTTAAGPSSSTRCARSRAEVAAGRRRPRQDRRADDPPSPVHARHARSRPAVRTSGEYRISNYLLWQVAYSELRFTDVLWPDFRPKHLVEAIEEFQSRERRFGSV